jgi:hypothetical protein
MNQLMRNSRTLIKLLLLAALLCGYATTRANTQGPHRDHLTPAEVELVRDTQALDKRTDVFIKAAERRLLLITDPQAAQSKQVQKDKELWGDLPKGTRAELYSDLAGIFDEAITNIDDVATRDENSPLLPTAVRKLGAAATRFLGQLSPLREGANDTERDQLERAVAELQEIIDAANKLPPETKTKTKPPKG